MKEKKYYCKVCGKIHYNKKLKFCSKECKNISKCLNTLIKYFKFDDSAIGTANIFTEFEKVKETLLDLYWNKNLTSKEIADIYNYPSYCNITGKLFKYLNIPTRTCKETNHINVLKGKISPAVNPKYKHGWHTTWDNKQIYYRSSLELNFAKELDNSKILYDTECLRIKYFDTQKQCFRCAIPDFYLKETNTIVEIKSEYTLNLQEMIDKMNAYKKLGYNFKLYVNEKEVFI